MKNHIYESPEILDGHVLCIEGFPGYGSEMAILSLRSFKENGKTGSRVHVGNVDRATLIGFAFGLLDVAEKMQPRTTYQQSSCVGTAGQEPTPRHTDFWADKDPEEPGDIQQRRQSTHDRFCKLRKRLPTLQLAQRVLEACDTEVAHTVHYLLTIAEQGEALPFRLEFALAVPIDNPETDSITPDASHGTTH